jgi:hypothetical protein
LTRLFRLSINTINVLKEKHLEWTRYIAPPALTAHKFPILHDFDVPPQAWTGPYVSRKLRLPEFLYNWRTKVARLSALITGRLHPQEKSVVLISVKRLSQPQGHSAARTIKSMKNSSDTNENRTRDPPACSAVP